MSSPRWSVLLVVAALVTAACGGGSANSSSSRPGDLVIEVASYDLAVGPPTRFIVGALTADHRFVGYGRVEMRFAYLGTAEHATATPSYGPATSGSFLVIPGTDVPSPMPAAPTIIDAATGRGVYATQAAFDRAG